MTAWFRGVLVAAAFLLALLGASTRDHSWAATIMVLLPSAVVLIVALRQPARPMIREPALTRGVWLWSVLVGAALLWEAYAFVRQPDWSLPSHSYPTMSTLLDPVLEHGPLRIVGWLVWLGIGARLVTR